MNALRNLSSPEAEQGVIGGAILRPDLLPLIDVDLEHFLNPHLGHIWAAIRNLEAADRPIDQYTIIDQLTVEGHGDDGTIGVLAEAALRVPVPENVEDYAATLRRLHLSREIAKLCSETSAQLWEGTIDGYEAETKIEDGLRRIRAGQPADRGRQLGQICAEIIRELEAGTPIVSCIPTGIAKLDANVTGIPIGVPSLVLARPGWGKSSLAGALARAAEDLFGDAPLIYSYEDSQEAYGMRTIAQHSGVATDRIRSGELIDGDTRAIARHYSTITQRRTDVIRAANMSIDDIDRDVRARRLRHRGEGTCGKLVIIDYIQRMPLPTMHGASKNDRVGEISRRLADLAATQQIAVVVCSQVGRQVGRESRAPNLHDARDSGELEGDAKFVLGLHRPDIDGRPHVLEIHVLKNNQGQSEFFFETYWDLATHHIVNSAADLAGR